MSGLGRIARPLLERAGRGYVAGATLDQAVQAAAHQCGPTTLGYWSPVGESPAQVAEMYSAAARAIAEQSLDAYVSMKLPSLAYDETLVRRVVETAVAHGVAVLFDSLGPDGADRVIDLACTLAEEGVATGAATPAAWSRSADDARRLVAAGARVRVVKGQWPGDRPPHEAFIEVVAAAAGGNLAIATHDVVLARAAFDRLEGAPAQLELLWGLPRRAPLALAAELGVSTRLYVPFGYPYTPYELAHARGNARVLWWLARDAIRA
jgi:proline dehydrogenase